MAPIGRGNPDAGVPCHRERFFISIPVCAGNRSEAVTVDNTREEYIWRRYKNKHLLFSSRISKLFQQALPRQLVSGATGKDDCCKKQKQNSKS